MTSWWSNAREDIDPDIDLFSRRAALEVFTPVICCESAFLHPETAFLLHKIVVQHGR
jgi:hypothetical protein